MNASPRTSSAGASSSAIAAAAMSRTWTSGRHDVPSLRSVDRPGRVGPADEVVEHDVEPEARRRRRRPSRSASRPARSRASASSSERLLRAHLRLRVGGQRPERRAPRRAASSRRTAPYIEHDDANTNRPTPASLARRASWTEPSRLMSYVQSRVEVADRVVRERREVDDRVEARELGGRHVADVAVERRGPVDGRPEVAARGRSRCRDR